MSPIDTPAETPPGEAARALIRTCDRAVLATHLLDGKWPYASLVLTACDHAARPILLISELAEHTRNLGGDPRCSLLFDGTAGLDSPLTGARVTVLGRTARSDDDGLRARYVARHPDAEMYLDFADFHLYVMTVERAHIVAGFGAIHWLDARDVLYDVSGAGALGEAEGEIVAHMNGDHAEAVGLYAAELLRLAGDSWRMTGIDPEGIDLRLGGSTARLVFDSPVLDPAAARRELARLARRAREQAGRP